jgi:hypothetical protein
MSDELKDFRYYADKAEAANAEAKDYSNHNMNKDYLQYYLRTADMYAELAKAAPKVEPVTPARCPDWLSRGNRVLADGFLDYQCVLFAGHDDEHESSVGHRWITEAGTRA